MAESGTPRERAYWRPTPASVARSPRPVAAGDDEARREAAVVERHGVVEPRAQHRRGTPVVLRGAEDDDRVGARGGVVVRGEHHRGERPEPGHAGEHARRPEQGAQRARAARGARAGARGVGAEWPRRGAAHGGRHGHLTRPG
jgi:hypothetical protein